MERCREHGVHVHPPLCLSAILCNGRTGTKCYKQEAQMREEKARRRKKKAEAARPKYSEVYWIVGLFYHAQPFRHLPEASDKLI